MTANPRHSSNTNEHLTPEWLVKMSRRVLGGIDLDPASCEFANRVVHAERFFTKADNGLFREWHGRVFLNPPGGLVDGAGREVVRKTKARLGCTETGACGLPPRHQHEDVASSATFWWHKLMHEFTTGGVEAAIFVGFSLELLQGAQGFVGEQPLDFPCCVPKQRVRFELEVGGRRVVGRDPTHANVIVLVCSKWDNLCPGVVDRFITTFRDVGYVHVPRGFQT